MSKPESHKSVWDAIADTPEQAANLRARAELMQKIAARLRQHEWTQDEAARRCGVTQPRINDLLRGRVGKVSTLASDKLLLSLCVSPDEAFVVWATWRASSSLMLVEGFR
jgi:predicted XRE-type DNA-binding protein